MSRPVLYGVLLALAAESVALHALLFRRWPFASILLLALNIGTIWWLVREAGAESGVTLGPDALEVRHGLAVRLHVPVTSVRSVQLATWQSVPPPGTAGYVGLGGGDDPNVLVTFDPPAALRLAIGVRRPVKVLGLRLDAPGVFVDTLLQRLRA